MRVEVEKEKIKQKVWSLIQRDTVLYIRPLYRSNTGLTLSQKLHSRREYPRLGVITI